MPGAVAVVAIAAALALPRLALQCAGPDAQLSLMMDDASYYLEGARRMLTTGGWPSGDGVHATNGFHPLYMGVVAALTALMGGNPRTVVPAVFAFNLACNALAVVLLARAVILPRSSAAWTGVVSVVLLALSPGWLVHGTIGVENSLSALLVLAVVHRWNSRYGRDDSAPSARALGGDGMLLGLAVLARSDAALLALVYAVAALRVRSRISGWRTAIRECTLVASCAFLVVSPWWYANLRQFGTIAQDSAVALAARFATDYGPRLGAVSLRVEAVGVAFWCYRFLWAGGLLPLTGWLLGVASPFERLRHPRWVRLSSWGAVGLGAASLLLRANDPTDVRDVPQAAAELALGVLAFALGLVHVRPAHVRMGRGSAFALAAAGATVFAYAVGFRGFQVWYASGFALAAILWSAWAALPAMLEQRRALATCWLVLMTVQCVLVTAGWLEHGGREGMDRALLANGDKLRTRMQAFMNAQPLPVRWGSFDSGDFSYLVHPLPILNADGVMNHEAALAIRDHTLARWLRRKGVTHLVTSTLRIEQYGRIEPLPVVHDSAATAALGMDVWRLDWQGSAGAVRR